MPDSCKNRKSTYATLYLAFIQACPKLSYFSCAQQGCKVVLRVMLQQTMVYGLFSTDSTYWYDKGPQQRFSPLGWCGPSLPWKSSWNWSPDNYCTLLAGDETRTQGDGEGGTITEQVVVSAEPCMQRKLTSPFN